MPIGTPKDITECRRFFLEPASARQRQYEALRAYFVGERSSQQAAADFGYTANTFKVMCHQFRRDPNPEFFVTPKRGPQAQPKKSAVRELVVALRKKNYSVYDISETLTERGSHLSPTAVGEILDEEGFARLPRRLDEERPERPRPTVEAVANVNDFTLAPRSFMSRFGGLFLLVPLMVRLGLEHLADRASLHGSKMIPAAHALRACLSLKLTAIERNSHVMSVVADEGLALFSGLNAIPKKSYLAQYSSKIDHRKTLQMLTGWHTLLGDQAPFSGESFNLDFHSVPYYGDSDIVERHFVSARSRRQPSVLAFLAQDAAGHCFCYSNADLRKGEESEEIFRFIDFWKKTHGELPKQLVFDSRLTNQPSLKRLDEMGIDFITLRRRSPKTLKEVALLPRSAWRTVELDVPTRKYRHPRYYEQVVNVSGHPLRQMYITDLGHELPTVLLTNQRGTTAKKLITRYAQRMLIENSLSDAVRFFHMDALSSSVGLKVDFDMGLLVIASGLYRMLGKQMRGYSEAQARVIFRDIVDNPAHVRITDSEVVVQLHRRSHMPIIVASGLLDAPVPVPWWNNTPLRITT